jgi:hypothetical protein
LCFIVRHRHFPHILYTNKLDAPRALQLDQLQILSGTSGQVVNDGGPKSKTRLKCYLSPASEVYRNTDYL